MQAIGSAFKKMSQRAMWRGDRGQSQMIESHGVAGMRSNLLNDTPTYKKESIGLGFSKNKTNSSNKTDRNTNTNTKVKPSTNTNSQNQNKSLGGSILNSL